MALIPKAKLQGLALQFLNGKEELLKDYVHIAQLIRR
jgi:hypothetical protein